MRCTRPTRREHFWTTCGKCISCKLRRRAAWTMRMIHESRTSPDSLFLTLTYSPEQVVTRGNGTSMLVKSDLQKFFKRLRINRYRKGIRENLRYYACGEYGERGTQRAHYHSVVYGLKYNEEDMGDVREAWHHGHVDFGLVTPASIRYVAGYIDKKIMGYADAYQGREGEFHLMSNGIGFEWMKQNMSQLLYDCALKFEDQVLPLNRYYRHKLSELWPDAFSGSEMRIIEQSSMADTELLLNLAPEFGGRKYDNLSLREKGVIAARLYAKNKVYAIELEQRLSINRQLKGRL